ncbi:hypothetical protein HYDPIDRAFT_35501 [Hydnomerulius pinastri MD-312]|nr:hypothetical protein HYDPIDRAFT_35501 [Hydnomerulius pinastri MD-312]
MSMYSQAPAYGQVAYPASGFHQPGPSAYSYQPPPPPAPAPPVYHVDPNSFRRDFAARLAELTINSRPIIQTLSMFAQEYSRWADVVAQCLDVHIRRVPAWMKLPAFYLLDAISKNVYDPYARHFAPFVIQLFLDTYRQVDQVTRSKMEEMLLTWRTGAPNGKELFGVITQLTIERGVWGGTSTASTDSYGGSNQISKVQVLSELEFTLGQKERAIQANPWDVTAQKHIEVLQQLRKLVEAGVSQEELRQILAQLRSLTRTTPPQATPPPAPSYPASASTYSYPTQPTQPSQSTYTRPFQPSYSAAAPSQPLSSYSYQAEPVKSEPVDLSALLSSASASAPAPASAVPAIAPNNLANLYSALLKAGVVSADSTPVGAGSTNQNEDQTPPPSISLTRDASRAYRKAVLSEKIQLTTTDITRKRSSVLYFLYDRLPAQCKQCGVRFGDDSSGKKEMNDHLDMHFRQNRKASQNMGRGHSRSWFVNVEDWTHEGVVDVKGKGRADGARPTSFKAVAAAEAAQRDAELRAQFVVVPPGDEAKSISCPICKETMKSEFLEDDEEWVWKNAVKHHDRIYHATCHSEAMKSAQSLASRLRNETSSRSRSRTPETPATRTTPPKGTASGLRPSLSPSPESKRAMLKRKIVADDQYSDAYAAREEDGTPPMKKLALAA